MQVKNVHAKETDITAVLVIAFVLLVGVLIAKVANDFTKQTTSTQTKAAPPRSAATNLWCQKNAPLNGDTTRTYYPNYDGSGDKCQSIVVSCADLTSSDKTYTVDMTNTFLPAELKSKSACFGSLTNCCRKVTATTVLGDSLCRNATANPNGSVESYCVTGSTAKSSCDTSYGSGAGSDVKCAKNVEGITIKGKRTLEEGRCCNPPVAALQTNCGRKHINCDKFNSTIATDNDNLKNTNKNGAIVRTVCMATSNDAFCVNENATININGYIRCDGSQFATNVYGQYGCFTTPYNGIPSSVNDKFYCIYSEVVLGTGELCKNKIQR